MVASQRNGMVGSTATAAGATWPPFASGASPTVPSVPSSLSWLHFISSPRDRKRQKIYSNCLQAGVGGGFSPWPSSSKQGLRTQATPDLSPRCGWTEAEERREAAGPSSSLLCTISPFGEFIKSSHYHFHAPPNWLKV